MSNLLNLVFASLLLSLFPAQVKQASTRQAKAVSGMSMETGEACDGLSKAECCGQMLELAGFRAQGDYLPRTVKTTVQLACAIERRVVTPQVCRSISLSRGFPLKDADAICKPARGECQKDGTCRQCVDDLERLAYRGSHHVCRALTYIPDAARPRVVVIRDEGASADSDTRFEITRRRTSLR
jgi:hypothetical protein